MSQVSEAEINAYLALMKGDDRGRAFLKVSRSAQATAGKQELYRRVVGSRSYPVQVVWAAQDPVGASWYLRGEGASCRRAVRR